MIRIQLRQLAGAPPIASVGCCISPLAQFPEITCQVSVTMALFLDVQFLIIIQLSGLLHVMNQSSGDSVTHRDNAVQTTKVSMPHHDYQAVQTTKVSMPHQDYKAVQTTKVSMPHHDYKAVQTTKVSMTHQGKVTEVTVTPNMKKEIKEIRVIDQNSTTDNTEPSIIQHRTRCCPKPEQSRKIEMTTDHDPTNFTEEATKVQLADYSAEISLTDKLSRITHGLRHITTMETVPVRRNDRMEITTESLVIWLPYNHPKNLISLEAQQLASNIMFIGALPVLLLAGIPGNILSVAVFIRQGLRQKVNLLFFSLALADLTFLLVLTMNSVSYVVNLLDATKLFPTLQNPEVMFTANILFVISSLILTIISLDRCLTFTLSLGKRQMSWTQALACIVILISVAIIASIPGLLTLETGFMTNPLTNATYIYKKPTKLAQILPSDLLNLLDIVFKISCIIIVLLSSVLTSGKMCQATRFRSQSASTVNRDEMKIIRMIVVLCLIFVLCEVPDVVLVSFVAAGSEFNYKGNQRNFFTLTHYFSFLTKLFNSSANFFVYCIMGSRFRRTLLEQISKLKAVLIQTREY